MSRLHRSLRRYERRRVIVNDSAGSAYSGILTAALRDCVTLRGAEVRNRDGNTMGPADGDTILLRSRIESIQVLD